MKRIIALLMLVLMLCSESGFYMKKAEASEISEKGFAYDDSVYDTQWLAKESVNVRTSEGGLLGTMTFYVGLGRDKGSNFYVTMYKEVMEPNSYKVKINGSKSGYGLSEYLSVTSEGFSLLSDYYPMNAAYKEDTLSGFVGGFSVDYEIAHRKLDITSSCSSSTGKYYIIYDYKPSVVNLFASNKYVANESVQMGMVQSEKRGNKNYIAIPVEYDVRFGAASDSKRSPAFIYWNWTEKAVVSRTFRFNIE